MRRRCDLSVTTPPLDRAPASFDLFPYRGAVRRRRAFGGSASSVKGSRTTLKRALKALFLFSSCPFSGLFWLFRGFFLRLPPRPLPGGGARLWWDLAALLPASAGIRAAVQLSPRHLVRHDIQHRYSLVAVIKQPLHRSSAAAALVSIHSIHLACSVGRLKFSRKASLSSFLYAFITSKGIWFSKKSLNQSNVL